jgi:hypothetical protein
MHQFRYILSVFRGYSLNLVVILLLDFNGIYRAFKGFGHTYLHAFSNFTDFGPVSDFYSSDFNFSSLSVRHETFGVIYLRLFTFANIK